MPPLDEGTILFMPTTVPGPSVARIREVLRIPDEILAAFPEVETVWGTAGRAETATDPAELDMIETTIALRPRSKWRDRMTAERLMAEIDEAVEEGAVVRVRPKMMTVVAIIAGLLPILWSAGTGASVMKRIAAPMVGGMVSGAMLTLIVIPAVYALWREWELSRRLESGPLREIGASVESSEAR